VPANPPLKIARDLSEVGGSVGNVEVYGKLVMVIRGPQPGGLTAAERADILHARIQQIARLKAPLTANDVTVAGNANDPKSSAEIDIAGSAIYTVTPADARLSHTLGALALAGMWRDKLIAALHVKTTVAAGG
jgi:hypothetical protein